MSLRPFAVSLAGLWLALGAGPVSAQSGWIDAGQQAMIMHQGDLLEQQTAPNQNEGAQGTRSATPQCIPEKTRQQLRAEYERRVRAQGKAKADTWLRQEGSAMGRRAGERAKKGISC